MGGGIGNGTTNGAFFAVTKGELLTSDDMFKAKEVPARKARSAESKKENKVRLAVEAAAGTILEQDKAFNSLISLEPGIGNSPQLA